MSVIHNPTFAKKVKMLYWYVVKFSSMHLPRFHAPFLS